MKKILFLLIVTTVFVSCDKSDGKLDPNATIKIRPAAGVKLRAADGQLTALEIIQQTYNMEFWNESFNQEAPLTRGFSEAQRDYDTPLLKMWGTDIIAQDGSFETVFIDGHDVVLLRKILIRKEGDNTTTLIADPFTISFDELVRPGDIVKDDTIAYIPNRIISAARTAIKAAYDSEDYSECYRLFDNAFTFTPITGDEYKRLKADNLN